MKNKIKLKSKESANNLLIFDFIESVKVVRGVIKLWIAIWPTFLG